MTVTLPSGKSEIMKDTVRVEPRDWSLDKPTARFSPRWVDSIPGLPKAWGLYSGGKPTPETLPIGAGTGPWRGTYYLVGNPAVTYASMKFHNDLESGGPAYPVPARDTICGLSGIRASVNRVNGRCGYGGRLSKFRRKVVAHENKHETSLNACIDRVNPRLRRLEELVRTEEQGGRDRLENEMQKQYLKGAVVALFDARETDQGPERADIWTYRPAPGPWRKGLVTKGHNGKNECPHIT